mmetsp:Transcript_12645/g.21493  ORF Transcript_12645/g.21493 Transcript_12645/m.21493 type:complete len:82 (+) Transcript_12645:168-413(+)
MVDCPVVSMDFVPSVYHRTKSVKSLSVLPPAITHFTNNACSSGWFVMAVLIVRLAEVIFSPRWRMTKNRQGHNQNKVSKEK